MFSKCGPQTAASTPSGISLTCILLGLIPDLRNQKLWTWGLVICVLTIPPGDSDAC